MPDTAHDRRLTGAEQSALEQIRESLAFFGLPVDHLSDQEIIDGAARIQRLLATSGLSASQAVEAIGSLWQQSKKQ
jgi:hypothetical protein